MSSSLLSLPNEILFSVFSNFNDIKDYASVSGTCKKFQNIVKAMVLITGDGPTQSTFKSVSSTYLQLDFFESHIHYKQAFRNYTHIVFEYSLHQKVRIHRYTSMISRAKQYSSVKLTEVFLNKQAAHYSFGLENINDIAYSKNNYLYGTTRTIYLNGSDEALLIQQGVDDNGGPIYDSLTIVSHDYEFLSARTLPLLSVAIDPTHHLRIQGAYLENIIGVINYDQSAGPCRARDSNEFFKNCHLPNIKHLKGFNLKRGFDFKVFEKFTKLETVSFTFTSSDEEVPTHQTHLPNLKRLELSGNSIALINMNLPKLEVVELRSFGTIDSNGISDITISNVSTPVLQTFNLNILGNCRTSISQILEGFNSITSITTLEMSGNVRMVDFENTVTFPNLRVCILRGMVDWNNDFFNSIIYHRTSQIAKYIERVLLRNLQIPLMESLTLENLFDIQHWALGMNRYASLKNLKLSLDLKDPFLRSGYTLNKERMPVLETFELTLNKYLDFRRSDVANVLKNFIHIKIGDIKLKKLIVLKPMLELNCLEWNPSFEPEEIVFL